MRTIDAVDIVDPSLYEHLFLPCNLPSSVIFLLQLCDVALPTAGVMFYTSLTLRWR